MEEKHHRGLLWYIRSFLINIAVIALILGVVWFFFAKIKITASLDGRPLNGAIVKVRGVERCRTPCELRIESRSYKLFITPPDSVATMEPEATLSIRAMSVVSIGGTFDVPFHSQPDGDEEED